MSVPARVEEADDHAVGSSWCSRTVSPPNARGERTRNRVTGTLATSRSSTSTPAALSPAIIARFSIRAARLESRDVTTVVPLRSDVPYAIASFDRQLGRDVDVGETR